MGEGLAHFGEGLEEGVEVAENDGLDAGESGEFLVPDVEDEGGASGGVEVFELLEEERGLDVLLDGEDAGLEGGEACVAPEGGGEHIDEELLEGVLRLKPGACPFEEGLEEGSGFSGDEDVFEKGVVCVVQGVRSFQPV
jgi:hypothetical protein